MGSELKYKLTIGAEELGITEDLYNFPVYIYLDNNFYELFEGSTTGTIVGAGIDADFRKLTITCNDERCYTEVVRWDGPGRIGCLCTKLPVLSANQDTIVYLSYDPIAEPDFTYVGETTSSAGRSVWDENFIVVYHMWQFTGQVLDSTVNGLHGTAYNFTETYRRGPGHLGRHTNAYAYNNSQYIDVGTSQTTSLIKPNEITLEALVNLDANNPDLANIIDRYDTSSLAGYSFSVASDGRVRAYLRANGTTRQINTLGIYEYSNTWVCLASSYDSETGAIRMYEDGVPTSSGIGTAGILNHPSTRWLRIGNDEASAVSLLRGFISNVRVSSTARSSSWIKATSASNWNTIFTSVERYAPRKYNVSVVGDYIYSATSSGIKISALESGSYMSFLPMDNTTAVWASADYLYIGTTSSGIHRYDTALLTCLGEYKDYPEITASEIRYLSGNGEHLCVVTASGVNYINTYTDSIIGTDTDYAGKCFQTSTGQFYYTSNVPNYYVGQNDWNYVVEITFTEAIANDNTFIFSIPKEYLIGKSLNDGSDFRLTNNSGKSVPVVVIHNDFRGCYLLSTSNCAGVTKLHLLYGNTQLPFDSSAVTVSGATNTLNLKDYRYGFPSPAWTSWSKNGTPIENMLYYDNDLLKITCWQNAAQDHNIDIYSDYFIGNASATIMFTQSFDSYDTNSYLWLRFYMADGSYWSGIRYRIESSHYVDRYVDNTSLSSFSMGLYDLTGLRIYKIHNGFYMCWYSSVNGVWTYLSHTFPSMSTHSFDEPFYIGLSYFQTAGFSTTTYNISEFTLEADEFYGKNPLNSLPKVSGYSEVNSIKNLSSNWTSETVSHRFTSDHGLIRTPRIDDRIKVSNINDIYVAENTSRYGGNTIFLGTNYGASVIEEVDTNYSSSSGRYYLIKSP